MAGRGDGGCKPPGPARAVFVCHSPPGDADPSPIGGAREEPSREARPLASCASPAPRPASPRLPPHPPGRPGRQPARLGTEPAWLDWAPTFPPPFFSVPAPAQAGANKWKCARAGRRPGGRPCSCAGTLAPWAPLALPSRSPLRTEQVMENLSLGGRLWRTPRSRPPRALNKQNTRPHPTFISLSSPCSSHHGPRLRPPVLRDPAGDAGFGGRGCQGGREAGELET